MSTNKQKTKFAALITYVIVLICMIASFFIPVFDDGVMLFRELPGALGVVIGKNFSLPDFFVDFGMTSYYTVFNSHFNLAAWAVLIYTAVTVLAFVAFIIAAVLDENSHAAVNLVYISEILAILSLLLFAYDRLTLIAFGGFNTLKESGQTGLILLAVLAVIWLLYTVQSIYYKKSAGIAKSLLFVLSLAGLVCLFLSEAAWQGGFADTVADWLKATYYFVGNYPAFILISNVAETFKMNGAYIAAFITALIVLLNVIIDAISIAVTSNKMTKSFNLIRYGIELIAAIATAIIAAANNITPGIYLYALMVVALLQIVISTVRMFTRATIEESVEYEEDEDEESLTAPAPAENPQPALADGYYEAPNTTPVQPPIYTRSYAYQDDSFLNSLTPSERAEFYAIFIDKRRGNFYFLPEYEIGGDNKEFFQSMFIYLGKIMGSISDGLMNKIYRRLNMIT